MRLYLLNLSATKNAQFFAELFANTIVFKRAKMTHLVNVLKWGITGKGD